MPRPETVDGGASDSFPNYFADGAADKHNVQQQSCEEYSPQSIIEYALSGNVKCSKLPSDPKYQTNRCEPGCEKHAEAEEELVTAYPDICVFLIINIGPGFEKQEWANQDKQKEVDQSAWPTMSRSSRRGLIGTDLVICCVSVAFESENPNNKDIQDRCHNDCPPNCIAHRAICWDIEAWRLD